MSKNISTELIASCGKFTSACQREKGIAAHVQAVLAAFGEVQSVDVAIALPVKQGSSDHFADSITGFRREKQASRERAERVEALHTLQAQLSERKRLAADETQRCYADLVKQAHSEFGKLWGRTPYRFSFWTAFSQQEYEWRTVILNHLLALAQDGSDDRLALLKTFLCGDRFTVNVLRGFTVKKSDVMAVIHPKLSRGPMHVPDELPFRDAYEQILNHRVIPCLQ